MTHIKANKSKILTLILGLTMCLALMLGIVLANPADTARAEETDPRTVVSTITASSDVDTIIGFGNRVVRPTFNITEGAPAKIETVYNWEKKTATSWEDYSGAAFTEGTYRYVTQVRIEGTGATTHVLDKNGITVTVNDVKWDSGIPDIYDTYSFAWISSKEYTVTAPAGTPLDFIKDNKWDIKSHYINQAITAFSVADGAAGGTKPYTFSKVSGPEWIDVAADGTVSGTPTALGANADLVIKVTDSGATHETKEITLRVGNTYVLPEDREVINVIRVTSNIGEILGYGKRVVKPSFTFTEGTQANFPYSMGHWYKKEGTAWKRYKEATFTEGTYMYSNQLRVDGKYGMSHVLNKDGVSVYIDDKLCVDNQKPDAIYDDYSYIYVGTIDYEVVKEVNDELVPVTDLEKVFDDNPQEPTFGGTLVRGTDFEVSYAVKAGSTGGLDFSGKPVDAGTYVVTVTGKGAYVGSFTKEFVIDKKEQSAPSSSLFTTVAPTSETSTDGKITGITDKMEYRKVGDSAWTMGTGSDVTGLSSGKYQIRFKETDNYKAGAVTEVEVPESGVSSYSLTVNGGTGGGEFEEGASVTITANEPTIGKKFSGWTIDGITGLDTTQTSITFNMPANAVTATANYEDIEYTITVTGGTADKTKAKYGESVTITANAPTTGQRFTGWTIEGISGLDTTKTSLTFNMPADNVTATANYEDIEYTITVIGGTADKTKAKYGESVTLTANAPGVGGRFAAWTLRGVSVADTTKTEITFNMPAGNVTAFANYANIGYTITVNGGTADKSEAIYGASVTITANAPATGKKFSGWTIEGITGLDTTQTSITFNMPADNVTATANYEDIEYTVTVNGGTSSVPTAKYGESVTITANAPGVGERFVEWTSESGITFADKTNATTTFTMPAEDVTVEATFAAELYRVEVINGNAIPEMATYQAEVTVKANAPGVDEYFDKWEVEGLDTKDMDLTKTEIKFNMPAGNVKFTATYLSVTKYGIVMVDGTKDKEVAKAGETVTITAGTKEGKVFDKWTCETAGVTIEFESATSSTTTFVMPACEIEIKAHFRNVDDAPSVEIKVNGGTGAGVVKKGESITVTANEPAEGKEFVGWQDETGKIVSTKKEYTFEVKDEMVLTAVYQNKAPGGGTIDGEIAPAPDKNGLSGGAIAGIVIGSFAGVGIVGFAIFWFVVKKKSFADLISAIKETVNKVLKKGNKEE